MHTNKITMTVSHSLLALRRYKVGKLIWDHSLTNVTDAIRNTIKCDNLCLFHNDADSANWIYTVADDGMTLQPL